MKEGKFKSSVTLLFMQEFPVQDQFICPIMLWNSYHHQKKVLASTALIYGENLHNQSLSHMKKTQFSVIILLGYTENINYSAQTLPHTYPSPTLKFSAAHRPVYWTYAQMKYNQIPMQSTPPSPSVCNCRYVTDHYHHHQTSFDKHLLCK